MSWPQEPFKLITKTHDGTTTACKETIRVAQIMALTHNTMFRAFNAIYTQAPSISPSNKRDVKDLLKYTETALDFLESHHEAEEKVFFPLIETKANMSGLMAANVEQHRGFDEPFGLIRAYIADVRAGKSRFDAQQLRRLIDALAEPLELHLREEIPTIYSAGAKMGTEMSTCYRALHDEAERTTDPFRFVPPQKQMQGQQLTHSVPLGLAHSCLGARIVISSLTEN
ncbi:NAD(P)-binding protein [Paramyrothecium foliicola]|nr:NAD(P)-binding protein [Paramyrothecium foliicola]